MYFQLKGIGIFALIPLIGIYVLLPLSNWVVYLFYQDMDMLYTNIVKECQLFLPMLSVWYLLFILEHLVEEPGHELLYVGGWNKLYQLLFPYAAFLLLMLPLFFAYTYLFSKLWWLYIKLAVIQFLYLSVVYVLAFLSGKIIFCIMVVLCYGIYVIMSDSIGTEFLSYLRLELATGLELFSELKVELVISVLLLGVGVLCNYYFPKRNRN